MALNLNCRCSETTSSITATIYHHWTTLDREIEFHFVNGELLSYMLCVLWLRVCYLPFQGRYDIKFLVTEFWESCKIIIGFLNRILTLYYAVLSCL